MPNAFDDNAQDVGLSLDLIADEIEAGLPMHSDRLCAAFDNEEFYAGRNLAYVPRRESEEWSDYIKRPKRTSKILRRVVRKLTEDLYSPGPMRKLAGSAGVDTWLQDVYTGNHINALLQEADRKATLNGVSAVQAVATGRPEKPMRLYLWGAHEFVAWSWPDDPGEAWAVVTIAREQEVQRSGMKVRARYDAWSRDEHRVYRTKWQDVPAAGFGYVANRYRCLFGQAAKLVLDMSGEPAGSGKNPYGVMPFSFIHDEAPIADFFAGGLGGMLRECNAEIDRELSDLALHAREFMDPDRFTRNIKPGWRREKRPGAWQPLPPGSNAEGDAASQPDAFLVQAALAIEQVWFNIRTYASSTLEELGVPIVAVEADASVEMSGIAIVAKHMPLMQRTKARQPQFTRAECELKEMVLTAAGNFYGEPQLLSAVESDLAVLWPEPKFPLPTPERETEDRADLLAGRKSVVQVTAEHIGGTTDQAWEQMMRVLDENERYAAELKKRGLVSPDPVAEMQQQQQLEQQQAADATDPNEDADLD